MMKKLQFVIGIIFTLTLFNPIYLFAQKDQCFVCHEGIGDKASTLYKNDVHYKMGISCAACHGGNSNSDDLDISMSKANGFKGIPKGNSISETCSGCHSNKEIMQKYKSRLPLNQLEILKTSVHGKLSTIGKETILQCTSCHNSHGVQRIKSPSSPVSPLNVTKTCTKCHSSATYMRNYNPALPIDQLEKYRTSVHGIKNAKGDSKVAECASCHGGHDIRSATDVKSKVYAANLPATCAKCHSDADYMKGYKIPVDQYEKYKRSVHGIALLEKMDVSAPACNDCHGNHGAIPPGVESISKVCGTCHALNADLFSQSPHKKAFDENNYPECETCHGHHEIITATNKLIGVSKEAVCSKCHEENKSATGYKVAKTMRQLLDSLTSSSTNAEKLVLNAEQKGMEISDAKFKLRDAKQAKLESRTMVHSFDEAKFTEVIDKGLKVTEAVSFEAEAAVDDYYYRRYGLMVSVLIISFVAFILFLYIRRIEKEQNNKV